MSAAGGAQEARGRDLRQVLSAQLRLRGTLPSWGAVTLGIGDGDEALHWPCVLTNGCNIADKHHERPEAAVGRVVGRSESGRVQQDPAFDLQPARDRLLPAFPRQRPVQRIRTRFGTVHTPHLWPLGRVE